MRALWIIACIVIAIAIAGLLVTGDVTGPLGGFRNQNLGYMFLAWAGDIFLVYMVIDILLLKDERQRWKIVKDRAAQLVNRELTGILADVNLVTKASLVVVTLPADVTENEERTAVGKATLQRMKELSTDLDLLKKTVDPLLLKGSYGALFSERAKGLGDLQLKYWSKFLEPEQMALIIDLQSQLESLDTHVSITVKYTGWAQQSELSKSTAKLYEEYVYRDLQTLLKIMSENIDKGMIEMP